MITGQMITRHRILVCGFVAGAVITGMAAAPSQSSAQATRTFVSGVGDDLNPCSRTAPCKTWAGAISKTAAGGEINALDPGGYGAVTINKSITIDGNGTQASILACGVNGIIINAAATDRVTIRDLRINGCRRTPTPGIHGIRILSAGAVVVTRTTIFGFGTSGNQGAGINAENNHADARLIIRGSDIHDNFRGMRLRPGASGVIRATVRRTYFDDNTEENVLLDSGVGVNSSVTANLFWSSMSNGGDGTGPGLGVGLRILKYQGTLALARISNNEITGNEIGIALGTGAQLLSRGNNDVYGNTNDGDMPTGTLTPR
jgi:hypothetical protein